jgi:transposase, IS5 family
MDRCHLKGETGDRLHTVLCAAGYNIRWLLRMIAKKGVTFSRRLDLLLCMVVGVCPNWQDALGSTLLTRALTGSLQRLVRSAACRLPVAPFPGPGVCQD